MRRAWLPAVLLLAARMAAADGPPVERLTATRDRIDLDGVWRFEPARGPAAEAPDGDWGTARVPGSWTLLDWPRWNLDGVLDRGHGGAWAGLKEATLARAWYEREVEAPAGWRDRRIVLVVNRVSTDAKVFVDGTEAGRIWWPDGEVDLTAVLRPGRHARLRLLVDVAPSASLAFAAGVAGRPAGSGFNPQTRGLCGEVRLETRPQGPRIDGVFVQTSVRDRRLGLDVDFAGLDGPGRVNLTARIRDAAGRTVKTFAAGVDVIGADGQTIKVGWPWDDAKLWEVGSPNLYTLALSAEGADVHDERVERFGFREFRIDGRGFLLNEVPIRLRPMTAFDEHAQAGLSECILHFVDGALAANANLLELWPWDALERGTPWFRDRWAEAADEKGLLLMYPALSIESFIPGWEDPGSAQAWGGWLMRAADDWHRWRNHPSIVMIVSTANRFANGDDLNPRRLGRSDVLAGPEPWRRHIRAGLRLVEELKRLDSTRPVTSHEGGPVGDLQATNTYLDLTPLQEREDWLSEWAAKGDKPFMAVEFGTPLSTTFQRGRTDYSQARTSEPLMTEWCAAYLGAEAYRLEPPEYRAMIRERFLGGDRYDWVPCCGDAFERHPAHVAVQALFDRRTWHAWRGWGLTGGMIPWERGHGWTDPVGGTPVALPAFAPGRAGSWRERADPGACLGLAPGGLEINDAGRAIVDANRPAAAWIGGRADAFTEKDHHVLPGGRVQKTVVLVNDTRTRQPFRLGWRAVIGATTVAAGEVKGSVGPAETLLAPFAFTVPAAAPAGDGELVLDGTVGDASSVDRLAFRVVPPTPAVAGEPVLLVDPQGDTGALLGSLGWRAVAWDGRPAPAKVLVIGRGALTAGRLPGSPAAFVAAGGRLVIFGQPPDPLRAAGAFRVNRFVSRLAWPVSTERDHPVLAGLDAEDVRDWNGSGTLAPVEAGTSLDKTEDASPPYGWHWGNRGSVSGGMIEKPTRSGWTPLLEGEFDLAYTPLMEVRLGRGLALWCQLDLEARTREDPVAVTLASRLLRYAERVEAAPRAARVWVLGGPAAAARAAALGLAAAKVGALPNGPGLLVVGADATPSDAALRRFLEAGGRAFFLPRGAGLLPLGFAAATVTGFRGSLDPPDWPEARGLSASDLRYRTTADAVVLTAAGPGGAVAAEGLLGRVAVGRGVAVFFQGDPAALRAETATYFRYTTWRLTRAACQLLAGLGAEFPADRRSLESLASPTAKPRDLGLYVPGFRDDHALGDDPARYAHW